MKKVHLFNAVIFLAAFLLFQVELIISKIFLPRFGGSYVVWGACVVFFQATLLAGYVYAHGMVRKLGMVRYRLWHMLLLFLPLLVFPGRALPQIQLHTQTPLVFDVFGQLVVGIGLVFFVLSTSTIIIQSWLGSSDLRERDNPYSLFAVSNLGSFLALLSYPFIFEVCFDLHQQIIFWRVGYLVLVVLHLILLKTTRVSSVVEANRPADSGTGAVFQDKLRWLLLSAGGVMAFLSVTNIITYEITPVPLLWIIPLCIYLASFVLNFKAKPWCPGWVKNRSHFLLGFSLIMFFILEKRFFPMILNLGLFSFLLFGLCMYCQYELYKRKPLTTSALTLFYVIIAAGGFLGGIIVSWVMPLVSASMLEFPVSLVVISFAAAVGDFYQPVGFRYLRYILYSVAWVLLWSKVFLHYNGFAVIMLVVVAKHIYNELSSRPKALFLSVMALTLLAGVTPQVIPGAHIVYTKRNYYGTYKVVDKGAMRYFMHGSVMHGGQYRAREKRMQPATYYHPGSPVAKLFRNPAFNFHDIGIMGLGSGMAAAFGRPGQRIDYYEIDPEVFHIADSYFTFLRKSPAQIRVIYGDGRIMLRSHHDRLYDVLWMDAFSGDAIPVHLVTVDAIREFRSRLTERGILLFHVTNRYIDLIPLLFSNARTVGARACIAVGKDGPEPEYFSSVWIILTWDKATHELLISDKESGWKEASPFGPVRSIRSWTDTYYNILPVLDLQELVDGYKHFKPFYW